MALLRNKQWVATISILVLTLLNLLIYFSSRHLNIRVKDNSACRDLRPLNTSSLYHDTWVKANQDITRDSLYQEDAAARKVLAALANARITQVEEPPFSDYEKGTSEKWLVTLEGGQKAMMKLDWEPQIFGKMKPRGACNVHFEMPAAEIAAFHLHKVLGFRNNVFVSGRWINLYKDVLPVASQGVMKQIRSKNGSLCITGRYNIPKDGESVLCPLGGLIRASLSYFVPRKLKLYTYPPKYMPFSTPNEKRWGGFNNCTYCKQMRSEFYPYKHDWYYRELFDFAVLDALMLHYDSKHYVVYDDSKARGLTVRLDHGRAFCSHTDDHEHVMLAPIRQCCTLRAETYRTLHGFRAGDLSAQWKASMDSDPLAPIMEEAWMQAIERRRTRIIQLVHDCARANNGLENVLIS